MRKLAKSTFIFVAIMFIALSSKVYAASLDCNIEIQTQKTEYAKGEEFVANVCVSNIQSEKGILALSAVLNYDKDSLNLLEMTGKNSWDTPAQDVSYNESTGKMVLLRDSLGKNNEVIFEMKFQVKQDSDANASITLNDITAANGIDDSKSLALVGKDLTITAAPTNPPTDDNNGGNNNGGGSSNNGGSSNSGNNNGSGNNNNGGSSNSGNNNGGGSNNNGGSSNSGNNNGGGSNNNGGSSSNKNNNKYNNNSGNKNNQSTGNSNNINTDSTTNTIKDTSNKNNTIGNVNVVDKATTTIPKTGVSYTPIIIGLIILLIIAIIYCYINMKCTDKYR